MKTYISVYRLKKLISQYDKEEITLSRFAEILNQDVNQELRESCVSGKLLSDYAKKKLEYINGNCIATDFPNNQPTLEWAGAVLDLLEELGLGNYR
jgi:hypothetical protein